MKKAVLLRIYWRRIASILLKGLAYSDKQVTFMKKCKRKQTKRKYGGISDEKT